VGSGVRYAYCYVDGKKGRPTKVWCRMVVKDWGANANWAQWRAFGASFGDGCADHQCAGQFFMCMKNLRFRFIKKYQNGSNLSFTYKWNWDSNSRSTFSSTKHSSFDSENWTEF
jgi:hypothetical protein